MKKLFKVSIFSALLSQISFNAHAACGTGSGHSCSNVKVTEITTFSGYTYVQTDGVEDDLGNCEPISNIYLKLENSHGSVDRVFSMLLSALHTNSDVTIRLNDTTNNTGDCVIGYAVIKD